MIVGDFRRRRFLATLSLGIAQAANCLSARGILAQSRVPSSRLGICSFSCHRHWEAVRTEQATAKFRDGASFYRYARSLGADGAQTSLSNLSNDQAKQLRSEWENDGGYLEGDIRIPKSATELDSFEAAIKTTMIAGATTARAYLAGRRYESWTSRQAFEEFRRDCGKRLRLVEPILRKHRFTLAIENHKDLTSEELLELLRSIDSEWVGINIDTGNNIALLEEPMETMKDLAVYVKSVHLKDMAVQPHTTGFLLSEITCGQGCLPLVKICQLLSQANANLRFNLEMATRDPLVVPCLTNAYWSTFPARDQAKLDKALSWVADNPLKSEPPSISGKDLQEQLIDEEENNRQSLTWMHRELV
jgi:3-oxoisoapionate decarboxylase